MPRTRCATHFRRTEHVGPGRAEQGRQESRGAPRAALAEGTGHAGDGGPALAASFSNLEGLAAYANELYVADGGNDRIRVITAPAADFIVRGSTLTTLDASILLNVGGSFVVSANPVLTTIDASGTA